MGIRWYSIKDVYQRNVNRQKRFLAFGKKINYFVPAIVFYDNIHIPSCRRRQAALFYSISYIKMNFILGQCGRAEIQAWLLCGWHLINTDWTDYKVTSVLNLQELQYAAC